MASFSPNSFIHNNRVFDKFTIFFIDTDKDKEGQKFLDYYKKNYYELVKT